MSRPRTCPYCLNVVGDNAGFDAKLNLMCDRCGKIAFAVSWNSELDIDIVIRKRGIDSNRAMGATYQATTTPASASSGPIAGFGGAYTPPMKPNPINPSSPNPNFVAGPEHPHSHSRVPPYYGNGYD